MTNNDAWRWLRQNPTQNYEQLLEKLNQAARRDLSPSGKVELFQLVKIFKWCQEHGVPHACLDSHKHLHKYREAVAYLRQFTKSKKPDESKVETVQEIIARIQKDATRQDTRAWARGRRGQAPLGHEFDLQSAQAYQFMLDPANKGLLVLGPGKMVQRISAAIAQYVDWRTLTDHALLDEIRRVAGKRQKTSLEVNADKTVLVPIANGTEEIQAVCLIAVLRRAGALVTVASLDALQITALRGVKLVADTLIADCVNETFDLIALPGGMPGAERLRDSQHLTQLLKRQHTEGRLYAAPAAVLEHHGLLHGCRATCHPAHTKDLKSAEAVEQRVVVNENCITSRGPGSAIEFALKLVELLCGTDRAQQITDPIIVA